MLIRVNVVAALNEDPVALKPAGQELAPPRSAGPGQAPLSPRSGTLRTDVRLVFELGDTGRAVTETAYKPGGPCERCSP